LRKRLGITLIVGLAVCTALVTSTSALAEPSAPKAATALPASSCGKVFFKGSGSPQAIIASDLPLQGAGRAQTVAMTRAIQFILTQRKFTAGKVTVGYQSCDDSTAQKGAWDAAKCTANAHAYAAERSVIGVIGTFNTGCAKLIIPILNRASGGRVAMISPANTGPGITKVVKGLTDPGEPNIYYPTGKRNYARVVATDDFQSPALAELTQQLGKKSVYILTDNEAYGKGVADAYNITVKKLGIAVRGYESWDPKASSYEALANKIKGTGAQVVFLGGIVCNNGGKLVKDLRAGLGAGVTLIAPDGFTPISAVVDGAGAAAEGVYVSVAGYPNEKLGPAGKKFVTDFAKFQKSTTVDPYAVYAAQAAVVLLDAIARSDGSRNSVSDQLFKTNVKDGILGSFTLDKNGDTSLRAITVYRIKGGKGPFDRLIIPKVKV
jgi:branched-chain amino acid transport system substrate-binding protein